MVNMDQLMQHLKALEESDRYRVDAVLKRSESEITERVFLRAADPNESASEGAGEDTSRSLPEVGTGEFAKQGPSAAEQGPFIRKTISREAGLGSVYQRLWEAQQAGTQFVHLPRIFNFWKDAERAYVVMECISGITLDDWIMGAGAGANTAAQLFRPICEGVAELHQRFNPPIIHRDIKPANIMISAGHVTIIDFGIARSFDADASQDTKHFGTRAYAPPEQYGFGQTDQRSDVYALGMLLYFLLTGESAHDTGARVNGFANPAVSPALRSVLMCATEFDPTHRYASVEDLFQAFLAAGGEAVQEQHIMQTQATQVSQAPQPSPTPYAAQASPTPPKPQRFQVLGKVWNGLLIAVFLFFAAVSVNMTINPENQYATLTFAHRAFLYATLMLGFFAPIEYVLMDKRRLRQKAAWASNLRGWKLAFLVAACLIATFVILGLFTPPPA